MRYFINMSSLHVPLLSSIFFIYSQLSRCSTARGSISKLSLGVPSKDRAHKCFIKLKTLLLYVKICTVILILRWTVAELAFINKEII